MKSLIALLLTTLGVHAQVALSNLSSAFLPSQDMRVVLQIKNLPQNSTNELWQAALLQGGQWLPTLFIKTTTNTSVIVVLTNFVSQVSGPPKQRFFQVTGLSGASFTAEGFAEYPDGSTNWMVDFPQRPANTNRNWEEFDVLIPELDGGAFERLMQNRSQEK